MTRRVRREAADREHVDLGDRVARIAAERTLGVRIDPRRGTVTTLFDEEDGLWNPASLAFGTAARDRRSLYVTNYAVLPPAPAGNVGPALVRIDVPVPAAAVPSRP